MNARIARHDLSAEHLTRERCFILETWNDESDSAVSIARARVSPGVTTELHSLAVDERFLIVAGRGRVEVGDVPPARVEPGDIVVVPAGVPQRVTNDGGEDLVFYCVCSPRFQPSAYTSLE